MPFVLPIVSESDEVLIGSIVGGILGGLFILMIAATIGTMLMYKYVKKLKTTAIKQDSPDL